MKDLIAESLINRRMPRRELLTRVFWMASTINENSRIKIFVNDNNYIEREKNRIFVGESIYRVLQLKVMNAIRLLK